MTNDDRELLNHAADLLDAEAEAIRDSHTYDDGTWGIDPQDLLAKEDHDDLKRTAEGLRALLAQSAVAEQGGVPEDYKLVRTPKQKCAATVSSDPPMDCNWPHCGCDPVAERVMTALIEEGWTPPAQTPDLELQLGLVRALEQQRAVKIAETVQALPIGGATEEMPTPFQSGYALACEEIIHRLKTEKWEMVAPSDVQTPDSGSNANALILGALQIFQQAYPRPVPHSTEHNNPVFEWMGRAREFLASQPADTKQTGVSE